MASDVLWEEAEKACINPLNPKRPEHPLRVLLREPSHLLLGYALECLLKGLIIARDPALITQIMTHNVLKLSEMTDFEVPDSEKPLF
jgi:hypothetical protein